MPALNLTFTDTEMDTLRTAAQLRDVSLKTFAHDVVTDAAREHKRRVDEAARKIAERSRELNRRLA